MTVYSENNVPVLVREPGARIGLSLEIFQRIQAEHEEAQAALQEAAQAVAAVSDNVDSDEYAQARDAQSEVLSRYLLLGHVAILHNADPDRSDQTVHGIGGSDIKEALQEVIGGHDRGHVGPDDQSSDHIFTPEWVASTHPLLGEALADYYSCELRDMSEVA